MLLPLVAALILYFERDVTMKIKEFFSVDVRFPLSHIQFVC